MKCPYCGYENNEEAKFCEQCGSPLQQGEMQGETQEEAVNQQEYEYAGGGKKRNKLWILAAAAIIAAAAIAAVFLWILPGQKEKQYSASLDEGNKYLEEMSYENAEDAFLEAISIDPKKPEPYVMLAGLYLDTGEREKAKEIIAEAKEAVPAGSQEKIENLEEERKDELNGEGTVYDWAVEPQIEADDIYYLRETNVYEYAENETKRQMFTEYAVIKQGDSYGLIDMDGQILDGMDYKEVTSLAGYYVLTSKQPVYEPEEGMTIGSYYLYDDELIPAIGITGDVYGFKGAFYYCDGLHNIFDAYGEDAFGPRTWTDPEDAIPVKNSDITLEEALAEGTQDWMAWLKELPGGYGIYDGDGLATEFIYDACGSQSSGLLAVEQDGKWGYVDSEGNAVIPIEYDASWAQYTEQDGTARDFCYAAAEGYVPLVKDGVWEMRDAKGDLVIDPGVFEEIRPVYDGKCWVKQDGRWGVIALEGGEPEEEKTEKVLSADSSMEEIRDAVLEHLNAELGENGGSYSISDSETTETDTTLQFMIRYAIPEEESDAIIAAGGSPSANRLVGNVTVDRTTGTAVFEPIPGETEEWQLWESTQSEESDTDGFSQADLENIAAALNVPEDADVEIKVEGEPYYWDAGQCWLVSVNIYQDGELVAGASVDQNTKEPVRDILTYMR